MENYIMTGEGYLIVRVSTASGTIMIEDAVVSVYSNKDSINNIFLRLATDASGVCGKIALPAPDKNLLQYYTNKKPYATYNIEVSADGYFPSDIIEVKIFDTLTIIDNVMLLPEE